MFEHFSNVKPQEKGSYFAPGRYLVEVVRCKALDTMQTGTAFVASLKVLESTNETDQPVGSVSDFYVQLSKAKYPQEAHARVAAFIYALAGAKDTDNLPLPAILKAATGEGNTLEGLRARVHVTEKPTKSGGVWTDLRFSPDGAGDRARVLASVAPPAPSAPAVPSGFSAPAVPSGFFRAPDGGLLPIPPGWKIGASGGLVPA